MANVNKGTRHGTVGWQLAPAQFNLGISFCKLVGPLTIGFVAMDLYTDDHHRGLNNLFCVISFGAGVRCITVVIPFLIERHYQVQKMYISNSNKLITFPSSSAILCLANSEYYLLTYGVRCKHHRPNISMLSIYFLIREC